MNRYRICVVCLLVLFALVGCSTANNPAATPTPMRHVKVQLDWIHTVEYAGFYMAQTEGDFAEENLSVELIPNDGSVSTEDALNDGNVDFALVGADIVLRAREAGKDIVAIETIYQPLPLAFMSLAEEDIHIPADLVGKTVMLSMGRTSEYAFKAMLDLAGVDSSTVNIVPREVYDETPLLNHDVDVIDVFVTNQVVQMQRAGVDVNLILPLDYGVEMYVNTIATRQALIDSDPELVAAFTRAVTKGMAAAVADPIAATRATVAMNSNLVYDSELESMNSSLPLIMPSGSAPGMMNPSTWDFIYGMLSDQNILTRDQDVTQAYNLTFVNTIYGS
jgi:NitT/TauT family transport system substrate-binding protein